MSGICKANQRQSRKHESKYKLYADSDRANKNKMRRMVSEIKKKTKLHQVDGHLAGLLQEFVNSKPLFAKQYGANQALEDFHSMRASKGGV